MYYKPYILIIRNINLTYFSKVIGGIDGRVENLSKSFYEYSINKPLRLVYEFYSALPNTVFPTQLFRVADVLGDEFHYSFPDGENYNIGLEKRPDYLAIMCKSNSRVDKVRLRLNPNDNSSAPVDIIISVLS